MTEETQMPSDAPWVGRAEASFISVVIPAHNESEGIEQALQELKNVLRNCNVGFELIVVDDGSSDETYNKVIELARADDHVKGIRLSRNFGKESAILAGLRVAKGAAVVTIDADLQHPPQLIPEMLDLWRAGVKVVHAVKQDRSDDSVITRLRAAVFNALLSSMGGVDVRNSSDFKLLDRVAVNILVEQLPERKRFYRGLADWVGFKQASVPFAVASRSAGEGKWSLLSLLDLASTAIVSFTSTPLRVVTVLGFVTLVFAFVIGIEALWSWFSGHAVSGFVTTIMTVLMLGSFIMISLGVVGEYIAKIYEEIKARPSFLVQESIGLANQAVNGETRVKAHSEGAPERSTSDFLGNSSTKQ